MERVELSKLGSLMVLVFVSVGFVSCGGESKRVGDGSDWSTGYPGRTTLSLTLTDTQLHFTWHNQAGITEYQLLENPDGNSGYTVIATLAPNILNQNIGIFLPDRINASYILRACNSSGCTDSTPIFISGNLADAIGYVKASNTDESDLFGGSLALSNDGNTLVVGAPGEASSSAGVNGNQLDNSGRGGDFGTGAVYVFTYNGTVWTQQAYLKASNPDEGDWFGNSVSISADGNSLAVGAPYEGSNSTGINGNQLDDSATSSGAVYVYTRSGFTWTQQAYVKASNTGEYDHFGSVVSLSADGNILAVGTPWEDSNATGVNGDQSNNFKGQSGAAYIFVRNGSAWTQQAYIKASNTDQSDMFSSSLELSDDGNTLAIGAPFETSNTTGINGNQLDNSCGVIGSIDSCGATYVFTRSGATWTQQAYIKASNTNEGDIFGYQVAISGDGNTLAVGAWKEDSQTSGVNGDQLDNTSTDSGAVYVFYRNNNSWTQTDYLKASNNDSRDHFGSSLSLSTDGSKLVVGASGESSSSTGIGGDQSDNTATDSGAAYIFVHLDGDWVQHAYAKASNTDSNDRFGVAVTLSGNGNRLAIGANSESSNTTGIGGDQLDNSAPYSGAVYLY